MDLGAEAAQPVEPHLGDAVRHEDMAREPRVRRVAGERDGGVAGRRAVDGVRALLERQRHPYRRRAVLEAARRVPRLVLEEERTEPEPPGEARCVHERGVPRRENRAGSREREEGQIAKDAAGTLPRRVVPSAHPRIVVLDVENARIAGPRRVPAGGTEVSAAVEGRVPAAANAAQARHGGVRHPVNLPS